MDAELDGKLKLIAEEQAKSAVVQSDMLAIVARTARAVGSLALLVDTLTKGTAEDHGQLQGAMLVLDAALSRIEALHQPKVKRKPDGQPAGGEFENEPTPTDRHELLGVAVEISQRNAKRWVLAWKIAKALWYISCGAAAGTGWLLHMLSQRAR